MIFSLGLLPAGGQTPHAAGQAPGASVVVGLATVVGTGGGGGGGGVGDGGVGGGGGAAVVTSDAFPGWGKRGGGWK